MKKPEKRFRKPSAAVNTPHRTASAKTLRLFDSATRDDLKNIELALSVVIEAK
jgi:hypothetical protein